MDITTKEKKTAQVSLRLQQSTFDELYKVCQKHDRSMSYVIEAVLRKYLKLK